jgi:dihydropteroate synthase
MQIEPRYDDVVTEVVGYLSSRVAFCEANGILRDKILVDPGLGFGKTLDHNLVLQRQLERLQSLGAGVLLGPSRKAFIGALTGIKDPALRDDGTLGALAFAVMKGVSVVRVHNVGAATAMLKVFETLLERR